MEKRKKGLSPARQLAYQALKRVEEDNAYVDIVLSQLSSDPSLNDRDRALLNELVRGTVKWKKRLDWIVKQLWGLKKKPPKRHEWILWLALYQLCFLDNVQEFAVVYESVELTKKVLNPYWSRVTNGILRSYLRNMDKIEFPDENKNPALSIAIRMSHPVWLVERWLQQFGLENTLKLCQANNETPPLCVRYNSCQINAEQFEDVLTNAHVDFQKSIVPGFYRLKNFSWNSIKDLLNKGLLTVQDESAALPVYLADPSRDETIFDLCAAPGGKTTFLAELSNNQAQILAGDVNPSRIRLVRENRDRLKLHSVKTIVADGMHFPGRMADTVLLDAPCSGLGVLRKKPDLRWKRKPKDVKELVQLQKRFIDSAASYVKKGGKLIYSTCTIEPEENENVILDFLQKRPYFQVAFSPKTIEFESFVNSKNMIQTFPHVHDMDGSFAVKLIRVD